MFGSGPHTNVFKIYDAVFGTLFNDIKIVRDSGSSTQTFEVPICYGYGDKAVLAKRGKPKIGDVQSVYPRMSYQCIGMAHAMNRQGNKKNILFRSDGQYQFNRVPYDFTYELNVKAKNKTDIQQILSQILPYFTPTVNVSVKDNPELDMSTDIPIRLESTTPQEDYEGAVSERETLEATLSFTLQGWVYHKVKQGTLINRVEITIDDYVDNLTLIEAYTVPDGVTEDDVYEIEEVKTEL